MQIEKLEFTSGDQLDVTSSENLVTALFATMNLNTLLVDLDEVDGNAFTSLPELATRCQVKIHVSPMNKNLYRFSTHIFSHRGRRYPPPLVCNTFLNNIKTLVM